MRGRRFLTLATVATALTAGASAFAAEPRAVIELFTSQGCSSCPPADKLLGDLAKDPNLIPLSLAIDYWDYLGWKDTLAVPGHAKRQKAYSHAVRGDHEGVYTPQAVINGSVQALGSDHAAIEHAIADSRHNKATLSVPLALTLDNGRLMVSAPAGANDTSAEAWLCPVSQSVAVAIGRGENKGNTFTYHNVVRRWVKLGIWNGKATTWSVPLADFKSDGVDAVAVILQSGVAAAPGPMLGAAFMPLEENSTARAIKQ
jgi:hypothetical protein